MFEKLPKKKTLSSGQRRIEEICLLGLTTGLLPVQNPSVLKLK